MDVKRIVPALVLLSLGTGMLVYATVFHSLTVYEEEETEVSIPIPAPFAPPMPFDEHHGSDDGFHSGEDPFDPGMNVFGSDPSPDELPASEVINPFEQGSDPSEQVEEDPFATQSEQPDEIPPEEPPWLPGPSDMMFERITRVELIARVEPEWVLVREVTFGGVTRLDNGQLKRTYSGQPPGVCPT